MRGVELCGDSRPRLSGRAPLDRACPTIIRELRADRFAAKNIRGWLQPDLFPLEQEKGRAREGWPEMFIVDSHSEVMRS
jgi:hypothetical protein